MPRRIAVAGTVLVSAVFLFVFGLDAFGLVSADEPRYASIGREMASSGDWITPRLWGEAWFEKPPLLYWMIAAATRFGLRDEWAARLPVALLSLAFLYAYWRVLSREFSPRAGWYATAMLATSAGWVAFSHAAVMDLPLAAAFGGAMLAAMPWVSRGEGRGLTLAGALLGNQRIADFFEFAHQHTVELVQRETDAVVRHPVLLVVVRADFLAAPAAADLTLAGVGHLGFVAVLFGLEQTSTQDL